MCFLLGVPLKSALQSKALLHWRAFHFYLFCGQKRITVPIPNAYVQFKFKISFIYLPFCVCIRVLFLLHFILVIPRAVLATTLTTMTSFQMVFLCKNDKPFWRKVIILLIKFIRKSHMAKVLNQGQILKLRL